MALRLRLGVLGGSCGDDPFGVAVSSESVSQICQLLFHAGVITSHFFQFTLGWQCEVYKSVWVGLLYTPIHHGGEASSIFLQILSSKLIWLSASIFLVNCIC